MAFNKKRFDKEAQQSGKWVPYDGGEFLVASMLSDKFKKAYADLEEEYADNKEALEEGTEANLAKASKTNRILAETLLLGWKEVVDEDGEEIPYTVEEGVELLEDDPLFGAWLLRYAQNLDNYKREAVKKKAKK